MDFRRRKLSGFFQENEFMITRLPEKLIMKIFSYLSHKELCQIVRVSKQWRRIAYDEHLWQSLNLRPDYGGLNINSVEDLINLINQRSGSSLKYIEMNSDLITVPALDELDNKCTNLKYMTLDFSNAMQLHDYNELMGFPNSLYYLCICLSDVIFMEGLMRKIYSCLNSLEVLHLIGTFEMGNEEEEEIYEVINISKIKAHTPNLRIINLYGIAFVEDSHVELLAMNCIHLECVALNYCINVKGACFTLLLANCNKIRTLLLRHCGLKDEYMIQVPWEKSKIHELDISSTELSQECLESILTRFKGFTYLSLSHVDFFNDKIMNRLIDEGKFEKIEAIDLSFTPELSDEPINRFIDLYGSQLSGIMLHGKPHLAEYFWMMVIPKLKNIKICVLGTPHGWFFKYNTRVHVDRVIENFANNCPNLEALEIQWDPETIRFSDNSRKFIDHLRIRCWRLKSLTLEDGKYYEMIKGNFERASRHGVVRTTTIYNTTILILLKRFKDLQFN